MKRLIAAVAFSTVIVPALADNRPFEQAEFDRAVPEIYVDSASAGATAAAPSNLPFEQTELNRALPNVADPDVRGASKSASFEQSYAI